MKVLSYFNQQLQMIFDSKRALAKDVAQRENKALLAMHPKFEELLKTRKSVEISLVKAKNKGEDISQLQAQLEELNIQIKIYAEENQLVFMPKYSCPICKDEGYEKVQKMLAEDGFEDNYTILTDKRTYTAPFVNAEETEYLVIEDNYTNGRPPLELGGVMYVDRETVDKVERMKVCTCLNPLHTAMSIYGCLLDYDLISAEMADEDIRGLITKLGHIEAMPVVTDPGVLKPADFIDAVLNRRLPNPFMPDAPQRIATDTSQKIPIRFGETIKAYQARGLNMDDLVLLPLVLAGYARYLRGIDDAGKVFEPSPDPLLEELRAIVAPLEVKEGEQDFSCLKELFGRTDVFGVDLYAAGLGERIEAMAAELFAGPGAVRRTLHKYVSAR